MCCTADAATMPACKHFVDGLRFFCRQLQKDDRSQCFLMFRKGKFATSCLQGACTLKSSENRIVMFATSIVSDQVTLVLDKSITNSLDVYKLRSLDCGIPFVNMKLKSNIGSRLGKPLHVWMAMHAMAKALHEVIGTLDGWTPYIVDVEAVSRIECSLVLGKDGNPQMVRADFEKEHTVLAADAAAPAPSPSLADMTEALGHGAVPEELLNKLVEARMTDPEVRAPFRPVGKTEDMAKHAKSKLMDCNPAGGDDGGSENGEESDRSWESGSDLSVDDKEPVKRDHNLKRTFAYTMKCVIAREATIAKTDNATLGVAAGGASVGAPTASAVKIAREANIAKKDRATPDVAAGGASVGAPKASAAKTCTNTIEIWGPVKLFGVKGGCWPLLETGRISDEFLVV